MSRPPRPSAQQPAAARGGKALHGLDELSRLRGKLPRSGPAAGPPKKLGADKRRQPEDEADVADDARLFEAAVRGTTPLPKAGARVEIDTPKPPPVPRPREPETEDPSPRQGAPDRSERLEGAALFRAAMDEVTPLKFDERVDPGLPPWRGQPRPAQGAHEAARPGSSPVPLLLPPDADAADPGDLFRYATRGTQQIDQSNRVELERPLPAPEPVKRSEDEQAALQESLEAPLTFEDRLDMGDEAVFLRPGVPRRVLTDLRRGRWVLQGELDLHGHTRESARAALAEFLAGSLQRGQRYVRIIHGKGLGSPGKFSILKHLSRGWLAQRDEILAFCQAGPYEGGSGALLVLLKGRSPSRDGEDGAR